MSREVFGLGEMSSAAYRRKGKLLSTQHLISQGWKQKGSILDEIATKTHKEKCQEIFWLFRKITTFCDSNWMEMDCDCSVLMILIVSC